VPGGGSVGTLGGAKLPDAMRRTAMQIACIVALLGGVSNFLVLEFDIASLYRLCRPLHWWLYSEDHGSSKGEESLN
jgi:uncharacterized membrane protein YqgA involved in biofilm formation